MHPSSDFNPHTTFQFPQKPQGPFDPPAIKNSVRFPGDQVVNSNLNAEPSLVRIDVSMALDWVKYSKKVTGKGLLSPRKLHT